MRLVLFLSLFVLSCTNDSSDSVTPADSLIQDGTLVADTVVRVVDSTR